MNKYDRHDCAFQDENVLVDYRRDSSDGDFTWQVTYSRNATEADLQNNHCLEAVGEVIWSMAIEINACPFCGEMLRETPKKNLDFGLFDCVGFSLEVR